MKTLFGWFLVLAVLCTSIALPALAEPITVADADACFGQRAGQFGGRLSSDEQTVDGTYVQYNVSGNVAINTYLIQMQTMGYTVAGTTIDEHLFLCQGSVAVVGLVYNPATGDLRVYYDSGNEYAVLQPGAIPTAAPKGRTCFSCGGSGVCSCGDGYLMGERCLTCGGSAICQWCHGDGMIADNENYGNRPNAPEGVCAICYGGGVCQICRGAGRISGIATYGQGGSGYVTCSGCDGSGRCEYCGGTGRDD
jgi:hypothetical protein